MYYLVNTYIYGVYAAQALLIILWLALLFRYQFRPAFNLVKWVKSKALFLAASAATLALLGSMFFSDVMMWRPCLFCWYQRIAIFPQVFILWAGWKRQDKGVFWYSVPLALVGLAIAAYHWFLQLSPLDISTACVTAGGVSCVGRYIYTGPLTIAGMAFTVLAIIITLVWLQRK